MNIILEGPDNGGKSTLANLLKEALLWPVISSEGREKYPGEVNERVIRYLTLGDHGIIFDRHPIISQAIYTEVKPNTPINPTLVATFLQRPNLFIYCRPPVGRGMKGHVVRGDSCDTPEWVEAVENNFDRLVELYDRWALRTPTFLYIMNDNPQLFVNAIKELVALERK